MTKPAPRRKARLCAAALCAACGLTLAAHSTAIAQQPAAAAPRTAFTGRDFAGMKLSTAVQTATLDLAASRAWVWQDGPAQRFRLDRDVVVTLGDRRFHAAEAIGWIETVPGGTAEKPRRQAAFYFAELRDPTAAPELATRAKRLLVTVVFDGEVTLRSDRLERSRPDAPMIAEAESRMGRFVQDFYYPPAPLPPPAPTPPIPLRQSEGGALPDDGSPLPLRPARPEEPTAPGYVPGGVQPPPPTPTDITAIPAPPEDPTLGPAERTEPIVPVEGVVTFFGPERSLITDPEENALVISGGAAVSFVDAARGRNLQLTAQRAVVFLDPGAVTDALTAGVGSVRGVYLEGAVSATDGQFTLRGEKLYYDFATNRAVVLDAVFWTYDQQRAMPLYVRAGAIRQESENQWKGEGVTLSNSSFFEPHLSIGAESVTITRRRPEQGMGGPDRFSVDARGASVGAGGLPIIPLPRYQGDLSNPPLRSISVGSRDGQAVVRTTWDALALFGLEQAEGFDPTILVDGYFGRGPAFGTDTRWTTPDSNGQLFGYYIYDEGTDDLSSGAEIDRDGESRGMVAFEHRWQLADPWTLFLEGSYISDPAFVDAFFEGMAETRREFTNSGYLRRLDERSMFSLEVRDALSDFTPNEYLLQSQGYTVDRLPDARYSRVADTFLDGMLNWSSDSSISRVALNFTEPDVREFGFDTNARAMAAFGLTPGESLADRLRAQGLNEDYITRADTRHELSAPLKYGPLNITPFGVGRVTAYDDDFQAFSPQEDDEVRLFGAGGVRVSTTLTRVDDSVDSEFFDLHRMRHIVEPSATIWHGESNVDQSDLPVYDDDIDSLATGTAARVGITNTWQTMRGGADSPHSVDWFVLRTDYVWSSEDVDREFVIGRWYDARPELSSLGEYVDIEALWQLTDPVALTGRTIYDIDFDDFTRSSAGVLLDHGGLFSAYAQLLIVDPIDSTLLDVGARYQLTRKYAVETAAVFDIENDELQAVSVRVERRLEQWAIEVAVGYDDITGDTSFGVALRPRGASRWSGRYGAEPEMNPFGLLPAR